MSAVMSFEAGLNDSDLTITDAASAKLAELMADSGDEVNSIRVFVTGGGCNGMTYGMTFTDQSTPYDTSRDYDGFSLLVDAVALNYLRGAEIDFVDRPTGASFVFNNVFQATGGSGTCGACGASTGAGAGGGGGCG